MHVLSVSSVLRRMLQVLHLDVSKVNRVLHLSLRSAASPQCLLLLPTPVRHPNQRRRWALAPSPLLDVGDVQDDVRRTKQSADAGVRTPVYNASTTAGKILSSYSSQAKQGIGSDSNTESC